MRAENVSTGSGDFSGLRDAQTGAPAPLINYFTGQQFPNNRIPAQAMDPTAVSLLSFYPHANAGPNLFTTTQTMRNSSDQGGFRFDHIIGTRDQLFLRYAHSVSANVTPLSVKGANVPGFPVAEDISAHSASISETHAFGASSVPRGRERHRYGQATESSTIRSLTAWALRFRRR